MMVSRITRTKDYKRISRIGQKYVSKNFLALYSCVDNSISFSYGITASKKVGGAVNRNYSKRLVKNIFNDLKLHMPNIPFEVVIIIFPSLQNQLYSSLMVEFSRFIDFLTKKATDNIKANTRIS